MAQQLMNPTSIDEDSGLIPGLAQKTKKKKKKKKKRKMYPIEPTSQCFYNLRIHTRTWSSHKNADPDSVGLGGTQDSAFVISSHLRPMLLTLAYNDLLRTTI